MPDAPFISYAQNAEDVVLWRVLGHVQQGRYVEVGANHPRHLSITQAFYQRGWHGITIEPLSDFAEMHRRERPDDFLVEVAVSDTDDETITLHSVPGTGLSSIVADVGENSQREGFVVQDIEVDVRRLTSVLDDHHDDLAEIHFMTIDVEGAEASVLRGLDLNKWRPWVLVIEATNPLSTTPSHEAWDHYVTDAGYTFCLFDGLSRFYVANEHREALGTTLSYPACVFDEYIPLPQVQLQQEVDKLQDEVDALKDTERQLIRWRHRALLEWAESATAVTGDAYAVDREDLLREITALRESLSWRVTEPVRAARRAIGRLR